MHSILFLTLTSLLPIISAAPRPENLPSRFDRRGVPVPAGSTVPANPALIQNVTAAPDEANVQYSSNWAGAVLTAPPSGETFVTVSATWTLPTLSQPPNSASGTYYGSEWVGIDGYNTASILQAGTLSYVEASGAQGAMAWYEWYPQSLIYFDNFEVSPGDSVSFSVHATSSTTGIVTVENNSKGTSTSTNVNAPASDNALAGQNAEWIYEDFSSGGGLVPFAAFTPASLTSCSAVTSGGTTETLDGATILDIEQGSSVLASASVSGSSEVDVSYG